MKNFESGTSEKLEALPVPEVVIREEPGIQLLSLLLKGENDYWGETETPLAKETTEYFSANPLSQEILDALHYFYDQGVDEESLYNLSLVYQHPERKEEIFKFITKYKPQIDDLELIFGKLVSIIDLFSRSFDNSPLSEKIANEIRRDKDEREATLEERRSRVEELINFYQPRRETSPIQTVVYVPTDPLFKKSSGASFLVSPKEQIIVSNIDNPLNQDHEFLHGIINPIVEKISQSLTEVQKLKLTELASQWLKSDYGEGHFSLLAEELIRTYTEIFEKGETLKTETEFLTQVQGLGEDKFRQAREVNQVFNQRCVELGIESLTDFQSQAKQYYERYERNKLRQLVLELYREYANRPDKKVDFEHFILDNLPPSL